jgi:hypothetical protein
MTRPRRHRSAQFLFGAVSLVAAASCNSPAAQLPPILRGTQTLTVDCIAVLGTMPPSARTPLASVPYSGAPRDKTIADLTDDELIQLVDFDDCVGQNGFGRNCYDTPPKFVQEVPAIIAGAARTCYPTQIDDPSAPPYDYSREADMYVYRNQYGSCPVGPMEDCFRERAVQPWGVEDQALWAPDCYSTAIFNCVF